MAEAQPMTKAELVAKIDRAWNDFNAYLMSLTPAQVTIPTDPAGWTALDHVIHVADWENGTLALLEGKDRAAAMGIDAAAWAEAWAGDWDKVNGILQQRSKDKSLPQGQDYVMGIHQRLVDKINTLTDEDLYRPYKYFQPTSDREEPIINWLHGNTYEHYDEHQSYIAVIVADRTPISKALLLSRVQKGWGELNDFLASLTDDQKTRPTDAAGWTVKDHMIHMAIWEDGVVGLIDKEDRPTRMGIDAETWAGGDDDPINAIIQKRYQDMTLAAVEQKRQAIHAQLVKQIEGLSEAVIQAPYSAYNPNSTSTRSIADHVIGNTYMHYADHIPWMAAIAGR